MEWRRLKHFCDGPGQYGLNTSSDAYTDDGVRLLRTTDIQPNGRLSPESDGVFIASEQVEARHELQVGDLLFSRAGSLGRCFRVRSISRPMTFAGYLVRFRPLPHAEPRYLEYCAASGFFEAGIEADAITSTISNFNAERYANLPLPHRPYVEQRAIADFLDAETVRIDALITKKRRMVDLLEERSAMAIREVLAFGLGGTDELRGVGDPLLETVPAHWGVTRARFLCDIDTGASDSVDATKDGPYAFFVRSQEPLRSNKFMFDCEAVLTAGDGAGVGKVFHYTEGKFDVHQRVYVLHRFRGVSGRYFYYAFRAIFPLAALDGSAKSTVDSVRRHMLTDLPIPVPPPIEQQRIVKYLDDLHRLLIELTVKQERQIALLQEHRQALITAAVTGELEVPGVAG